MTFRLWADDRPKSAIEGNLGGGRCRTRRDQGAAPRESNGARTRDGLCGLARMKRPSQLEASRGERPILAQPRQRHTIIPF
jgi:hypothetical protein